MQIVRTLRSSLPLSLLLLIVASHPLVGCAMSSITAKRTQSVVEAHVEGGSLEVISRNGAVDIAVDPLLREVVIEATFRASGSTIEEAESRVAAMSIRTERAGGRLIVAPAITGNWQPNDHCSFTIRLPQVDGISVDTKNGAITVGGTNGPAVLTTSNGAITVSDHTGPLDLRTSNGAIAVSEATDRVDATTSNGSVRITLADSAPGPVNVATSNGSVTLSVGPVFASEFTLRTSNGRITVIDSTGTERVRSSGGRVMTQLGAGGVSSTVRTSNGAITIRQR